ncbi:hypothetical protein L249_4698 [Ophiocordyceps polyrhachis-furcata BCC 54312]|uniref:Calcineurin-like phosphoesterase domain-containing protein n=1 Tax=Ophiocordyceps polyrhachis-furcata BCC 54312 TaxID=1330021 RepID=A0A367L2Z8_9HYPO|nr:hypothetical protein L249_4698 [Ophiocordyceps polyrhachis-furcata BCC 54312]
MPSLSMAQQRAIVFAATFFFITSVYLCTTRLFNMSYSSDRSPPPTHRQQHQQHDHRPPVYHRPAADMHLSLADLPMSYGEYRRPGLQGLEKTVASLQGHFVPSSKNGRRLVVVGDIHGMDAELALLLDRVGLDTNRDHVIATGDMVGKGPNSTAVVARLMGLGASAVRGNHEDRVLLSRSEADAASGLLGSQLAEPEDLRRTGQADALAVARTLSMDQVAWLSHLPVVLTADPLPLYVVHAGLVPGVALEKQDPWAVMNMRTLIYPREELRKKQHLEKHDRHSDRAVAVPVENHKGEPWAKAWNRYQKGRPESERRTVVYGHDARVGHVERKYTLGLDSGCVRGGSLTAVVIRATPDGGFGHTTVQVACQKPSR